MNTISLKAEAIDKERIPELTFPASEVLDGKEQIRVRGSDIEKAMLLGNSSKLKVKIVFEDNKSKKLVDTTVWGVTDQRVILKRGVAIPTHRIHELRFFQTS
ncbi:MAG: hypothetical protein JKX74_04370 [Flavobacteriales bacterium]|nr:hypothetical protein [Flavobacteriales bacterium]